MTTEAILFALEHVRNTLRPLGLQMAVTGDMSLAVWKHCRATFGLDILVDLGEQDIGSLIQKFHDAGFRTKRADPLIKLGDAEFVQLLYEPPETFIDVQVDLLLAKTAYQQQALSRRGVRCGSRNGCRGAVLRGFDHPEVARRPHD